MKSFFMKTAGVILSLNFAKASNNDPVILVHGLGSTPETWEYIPELEAAGLDVFAVGVGKFTSNWDRACEAYANIMGTVTDYGACHAAETGYSRYGKDYTGQGLYPQWSAEHKIHLLGHSLGGQTIRVLEYLMRQGSGCAEDTSPLFTGGHAWITSMTTMSGVLDGTTFVDLLDDSDLLYYIKNVVIGLAGLMDNTFLDDLYTIDFTHWNLERQLGESFEDFWDRVEESGVMSVENKDISTYDMSSEGARELNAKGPLEYSDTYYFSFATERTHETQDCFFFVCGDVYEEADSGMNFFLKITANIIGKDSEPASKQKNDGLVNWENQLCPTVVDSDRERCEEFDGTNWPIGQWVYKNVDYLDHLQITTRNDDNDEENYEYSAKKLYVDHAQRLKSLPSTSI